MPSFNKVYLGTCNLVLDNLTYQEDKALFVLSNRYYHITFSKGVFFEVAARETSIYGGQNQGWVEITKFYINL